VVRGEQLAAALRRDPDEMAPMMFGEVPDFDEILQAFGELEERINGAT